MALATLVIFLGSTTIGYLQGQGRFKAIAVYRIVEVGMKVTVGLAAVFAGFGASGALAGVLGVGWRSWCSSGSGSWGTRSGPASRRGPEPTHVADVDRPGRHPGPGRGHHEPRLGPGGRPSPAPGQLGDLPAGGDPVPGSGVPVQRRLDGRLPGPVGKTSRTSDVIRRTGRIFGFTSLAATIVVATVPQPVIGDLLPSAYDHIRTVLPVTAACGSRLRRAQSAVDLLPGRAPLPALPGRPRRSGRSYRSGRSSSGSTSGASGAWRGPPRRGGRAAGRARLGGHSRLELPLAPPTLRVDRRRRRPARAHRHQPAVGAWAWPPFPLPAGGRLVAAGADRPVRARRLRSPRVGDRPTGRRHLGRRRSRPGPPHRRPARGVARPSSPGRAGPADLGQRGERLVEVLGEGPGHRARRATRRGCLRWGD